MRLTLALGLGLVVLVGLLLVSVSVFGLIRRSMEQAHAQDTLTQARALLMLHPKPEEMERDAWVKSGLVEAVWVRSVGDDAGNAKGEVKGEARTVSGAEGTKSVAEVSNGEVVLVIQRAVPAFGAAQGLGAMYLLVGSFGVLVLAFGVLTRLLVNPIRHLVAATERVTRGDLTTRVRIRGAGELADLSEHFNRMVEAVAKQRESLAEFAAEQQQANAALTQVNQDLQRAQEHLKSTQESLIRAERLASIGQLATGIAHEIGNPLASLLAYIDLLRDPESTAEENADLLSRAADAAARIQRIIRELLDYSRPKLGDLEPLDPLPAVRQALRLVEPQKRMRGIRLATQIPDFVGVARIDEGKLSQIIVNLLLNAADALQNQGEIIISATASDNEIIICVRDTGPGIPADIMPHILQPFFTTKPPGQGTGLGLAVCDQIAHQFGGRLSVESSPGQGATFCVHLPLAL